METEKIVIPFENDKFRNGFRNNQENIVRVLIDSNKKVVVLNAPTGVGKSIVSFVTGHYKNKDNQYPLSKQTLYICSSIDLQKQLNADFKEAILLNGRSNYRCNLCPSYTAEDCDKKCEEYKTNIINCDYEDTKKQALASRYTILNNAYYFTEINNIGRFSGRNTVIVDEADTFEKSLINHISLSISIDKINEYDLGIPEYLTKQESWKIWGDEAVSLLNSYNGYYGTEEEIQKEQKEVKRLSDKINWVMENIDDNWIFDHKNKFIFRPLWLTRKLIDNYWLRHANQFVLVSATMPPKAIVSKLFGLGTNEIDYIETDCPFPIANRQIIYNPIKRLKYGEDEQDIYREIERIIQTHKYQKGIIHSVSYDRMNKIAQIDPKRMITHNSYNKNEQLKKFYASSNGIFVSPSSERGLDLVGDLGRFVIWPKIPFGSLGDKVISKRAYSKPFGDYWYKAMAAQSILQGVGRTTRSMDDFSVAYILDSAFDSIVEFTPKYFRDAIIYKF